MSQDQDKHVAAGDDRKDAWRGQDKGFRGRENGQGPVSYTHLTLPTSGLV